MAIPSDVALALSVILRSNSTKQLEFALPEDAEHNVRSIQSIELAADEDDRVIDLATLCDTVRVYWVRPLGNLAVQVGVRRATMDAPTADNNDVVAPDGIKLVCVSSGEVPPKLHLSNPSASLKANVEIGCFGTQNP